jgi:hypothetical protein
MKNSSVFFGSAAAVILALTLTPGVAAAQGRGAEASSAAPGHGEPPKPAPTPTTTTPPPPPMGAVNHLADQPQLAAKLQPLLPTGTVLKTAATGFKTLGSFVSAVHVANNLDIPFAELKAKITGPNAESLGQAIHDLKPTADANHEVKKATDQAKHDQDGKGY